MKHSDKPNDAVKQAHDKLIDQIREYRENTLKLSKYHVADRGGITTLSGLTVLESKAHSPSLMKLVQLCEFYGLELVLRPKSAK